MKRVSALLAFGLVTILAVGCSNKGVVAPTGTVVMDPNAKQDAVMKVPEPKKFNQ